MNGDNSRKAERLGRSSLHARSRAAIGLLVVLVLAFAIPIAAGVLALVAERAGHLAPPPRGNLLVWLFVQHGFQLVLALIVIAIMKRLVPTDYGLHAPRARSYYGSALLWGAAFGVLMLLVDRAPELLAHATPKLGYALTPANVGGWLAFEGIYVGPTEEIPFRAMLVPFLIALWPARLRIGRLEMAWAGVVVALIFALAHATSFGREAWPLALGQQLYAFALGVLYAYWLEKSGSIIAPILGHNASDVVEYVLLFAWVGLA